jgi:hypothetical protein
MKSLKLALGIFAFASISAFSNTGLGDEDKKPSSTAASKKANTVDYRIQLGAFAGEAPADILALLKDVEGVTTMTSKGKKAYLTASFASEAAAEKVLPELRDKGFKSAMKVVVIEDYVIPSRTYHFFYDNKKVADSEKNKLFTPEVRVIK